MKTPSNQSEIKLRRSLLFVPGARPDMFPKALASGADVICIDFEDAVADEDKEDARQAAVAFFAEDRPAEVEVVLRINSIRTPAGLADIKFLTAAAHLPDGIVLAKVNSVDEIAIVRARLAPSHGPVDLHAMIETNQGLESAIDIVRFTGQLKSLFFGGWDMAAELRVEANWESLLHARQRLIPVAAAANIDLLDMPFFGLDDEAGLRSETIAAAAIGFTGKTAIHPKQIAAINDQFSPSAADVAKARDLIAQYEAQDQAFTIIDGVIMEAPIVKRLYRTIAIADRIGA